MRAPVRTHHHDRGQALVEAALVIPLLLLVLMGVVDVGRVLFAYVALEEAVHEGASYAARVPSDNSGITNRVTSSSNQAEVTGATVSNAVCDDAEGTITVTASYPLPLTTPVGRALFGGTFTLRTSVVATNLQLPGETCS